MGIYLVIALGDAAQKLLWYDELVTVGVAQFPHWRDVVNFYYNGLDTTSATPSLLVHAALRLPASPEVSARLPFLFAFAVMLACIFVFTHRRYPAGYAFAVPLLLLLCPKLTDFAVEARGYAFVLGGAAAAMICWQNLEGGTRWRRLNLVCLWLALAFAINAHTFAIFLFVPFALAQATLDLRRSRFDLAVWAALLLFPLGLLPVLHGQRIANAHYAGMFWSHPNRYMLLSSYGDFLSDGAIVCLVLLLVVAAAYRVGKSQSATVSLPPTPGPGGFTLPEWVFATALALMPLYTLPPSYLLHVYRSHYVVSFNIGIFLVVCGLCAEQLCRSRRAGLLLFLFLLVVSIGPRHESFFTGLRVIARPTRVHSELQADYLARPWIREISASTLPVVIDEVQRYSQLNFYAPQSLHDRILFLTDLRNVASYPETQTDQENFLLFGKQLGYHTMDLHAFLPMHGRYLVALSPRSGRWLRPTLLRQEEQGQIYLLFLGPSNRSGYDRQDVFEVTPSLAPSSGHMP